MTITKVGITPIKILWIVDCYNESLIDHDQLFYLVYEKVQVNEDSMEPHLWSYRPRISLEHLGQTIQEKKLIKCPILHEFLQKANKKMFFKH